MHWEADVPDALEVESLESICQIIDMDIPKDQTRYKE